MVQLPPTRPQVFFIKIISYIYTLNEYQPSTQIQNQMIVIDWGDFAQGIIRKGMVACGQ